LLAMRRRIHVIASYHGQSPTVCIRPGNLKGADKAVNREVRVGTAPDFNGGGL
jgi:hypothetical protein